MAVTPSYGFEDAEYFYFSGGITAYAVDDFSAGLMVNKANGEIKSWDEKRLEKLLAKHPPLPSQEAMKDEAGSISPK